MLNDFLYIYFLLILDSLPRPNYEVWTLNVATLEKVSYNSLSWLHCLMKWFSLDSFSVFLCCGQWTGRQEPHQKERTCLHHERQSSSKETKWDLTLTTHHKILVCHPSLQAAVFTQPLTTTIQPNPKNILVAISLHSQWYHQNMIKQQVLNGLWITLANRVSSWTGEGWGP